MAVRVMKGFPMGKLLEFKKPLTPEEIEACKLAEKLKELEKELNESRH